MISGSPAALIAADHAEDDGDDDCEPVRFHEAANDGADDGDANFPRKIKRREDNS